MLTRKPQEHFFCLSLENEVSHVYISKSVSIVRVLSYLDNILWMTSRRFASEYTCAQYVHVCTCDEAEIWTRTVQQVVLCHNEILLRLLDTEHVQQIRVQSFSNACKKQYGKSVML